MNGPARPDRAPSAADQRAAWLLVAGQLGLLALVVLLPGRRAWSVPILLARATMLGEALGVLVMLVAATALGRGLTAVPLPNEHARLRTGGLYRFVRHPIYSGLLLFAVSRAAGSASWRTAAATVALAALINVKARWEERHLTLRFPQYADYRERTPRFIPGWRR